MSLSMEDGEGQVDVRQAEHDGCAALAGDDLRALSISAMYSASTTGAAADIAAATAVLHRSSCGNRRSSSWPRDRGALLWFEAGDGQMEKQ